MTDEELFDLAQKVSLIPYAYASGNSGGNSKLWLEDRRRESVNPYYNQTESGLFLEVYYGIPGHIWTPWGQWNCWGSGSGLGRHWDDAMSKILNILGAVMYKPLKRNYIGDFGPVYKITSVCGIKLPPAVVRHPDSFLEYEVAKETWSKLSK